jgi:hypothetical protein
MIPEMQWRDSDGPWQPPAPRTRLSQVAEGVFVFICGYGVLWLTLAVAESFR